MNILPNPRHMMPPKLNGHIKTATPDDEAVLKNRHHDLHFVHGPIGYDAAQLCTEY